MIPFDHFFLNFPLQNSRETKAQFFNYVQKSNFNVGKRRSNFYYLQVHEVFEFRTLLFQDTALKANKVEEHQLTTASFLFHHSVYVLKLGPFCLSQVPKQLYDQYYYLYCSTYTRTSDYRWTE